MSRGRGASGLSGILLVDKPTGMTSHDIVNVVRRAARERRVGHAGTLDPAATGLLIVLVGPATRLEPYLSSTEKTYVARIAFGAQTDTDDADGAVVRTAPVTDRLFDPAYAEELLAAFLGPSEQMPPAYSAIKVNGKVSHRVARAGGEVELTPRAIVVREARLLELDADSRTWDVAFTVSKGTYIRSLARDIGAAAGSAAHLCALRRTASGNSKVERAFTLEEVIAHEGAPFGALFSDPVAALGLPVVEAPADVVATGRSFPVPEALAAGEGELVSVVDERGLAAVYLHRGDRLAPSTVLATPAAGAQ